MGLAEEERRHEHRLQRANATARLIDPEHACPEMDEIPLGQRRITGPAQQFRRHLRELAHQALRQFRLERNGPGDRHQEEADRPREVPHHRRATGVIDRQQRQPDHLDRERPSYEGPLRRRLGDEPRRQEERGQQEGSPDAPRGVRRRGRLRTRRPAIPDQVGGQKRDEPAVTILGIGRPIEAQLVDVKEPETAEQGEKSKGPGPDRASSREGRGLGWVGAGRARWNRPAFGEVCEAKPGNAQFANGISGTAFRVDHVRRVRFGKKRAVSRSPSRHGGREHHEHQPSHFVMGRAGSTQPAASMRASTLAVIRCKRASGPFGSV